jgi:hypothetical protein
MTTMGRALIVVFAAGAVSWGSSAAAQTSARTAAAQREQRYPISMMERVLESAVEHGAAVTRDRLQALIPAEMLLGENARARGFRLEGHGVFFDVIVPPLRGALPWSYRTLDQNDLALDNALKALRTFVDQNGDLDVQQALKRIELQVAPMAVPAASTGSGSAAATHASAGMPDATAGGAGTTDPILDDPEEAYRVEVINALMNAMLDYSRGLNLGADEWLTVGARRDDSPRVGWGDSDARTIQIRVRGSDLAAFLGGQLSRDEARRRIEVRLF